MDWGIRNCSGYLATSLPWRYRLLWSAISALVVAAWTSLFVELMPACRDFRIGHGNVFSDGVGYRFDSMACGAGRVHRSALRHRKRRVVVGTDASHRHDMAPNNFGHVFLPCRGLVVR